MRPLLLLIALSMLAVSLAGCHGIPEAVGDEQTREARAGGSPETLRNWTLSIPVGNPAPRPIGDCSTLLGTLNQRAVEEAESGLYGSVLRWGGNLVFEQVAPTVAPTAAQRGGPPQDSAFTAAKAEVTGTNNQESGVDEADLLKTDGTWTYVLQQGRLYILHSTEVGDIEEHAVVDLGDTFSSGTLLLEPRDPDDPDDDRLVVVTQTGDPTHQQEEAVDENGHHLVRLGSSTGYTHIQVFDLADRADPERIHELWVEGQEIAARLIDGHAYLVIQHHKPYLPLRSYVHATEEDLAMFNLTWETYWELNETERQSISDHLTNRTRAENDQILANATLGTHLQTIYRPLPNGTLEEEPYGEDDCRRHLSTDNATGRSISTILALHVDNDTIEDRRTQIIGSTPIVYGAKDALVLAAPTRDRWWFGMHTDREEATDIHWFDLDGLDVTHRASGRVPGIVRDSFGIDVHDDTFRIITVTGQWFRGGDDDPMMSHVALFEESDGTLELVGRVGGIAPGENLWSARFTDDRAYLITFEQTDPLWVVDLSDPHDPRILGELEVPGVSTYIHPLSDDLLLTIGYGPRADDTGLDRSRIQVNLFDISDPTDPTRADVLDVALPSAWGSGSAALHEHKAFTYWDRLGMLAIPVSGDWNQSDPSLHMGLRLIEVDTTAKTLSEHGGIDQDGWLDEWVGNTTAYHWSVPQIERSYFLGHVDAGIVSVYAMSALGITAHDLETLEQQDAVAFRPVQHQGP